MFKNLNKRQIIMLVVLLFLIVYYLIDSGLFTAGDIIKKVQEFTEVDESKLEKQVVTDIQKYAAASVVEIEWSGDWSENDPFYYVPPETLQSQSGGILGQLFGSEQVAGAGFELSGISWHGNTGYALINGEPLEEGQMVNGFIIDQITVSYVLLSQGKQTIRLTLHD